MRTGRAQVETEVDYVLYAECARTLVWAALIVVWSEVVS